MAGETPPENPGLISPGERRALLLGRIVLGDAPVWILDNPVDTDRPRDRRRLAALLERGAGRTLVIALRRPSLVERFGLVVTMRRGKVTFVGAPSEWRERRAQLREIRDAAG